MKVLITGGAGFIGQKLAAALLARGELMGTSGAAEPIERLTLFDHVAAPGPEDSRVEVLTGDIAGADAVARAVGDDSASIFHLAAVVSAEAEENFDLGLAVNLDGTRHVLAAARALPHPPRLLFASSVAAYGGADLPAVVDDLTPLTPQTSYGVAKSMGEFLIADMSRKGFIDGRSLRLPTICVRPGKPNRAASTWVSSMIREPLSGVDAICPVSAESAMACLSPRRVVDIFIKAHELPADAFGDWRSVLLNGITVTAGEIAEAVARRGNEAKLGQIRWQPDPTIQAIVDGWPKGCRSTKASRLGFDADASIDEIIDGFIEDDLADQIASIQQS